MATNPRAVRVAALIQRVIASSLETNLHDKRLAGITITEVRVTNDLQIAKVYWTQFGREGHEQGERKRAQQALRQATGRLRSLVGAKAGLRLTPTLRFIYDEVPAEATEIEDVLTAARHRDEELARSRANARYAGDPDPYRHDDDEDDGGDDEGEGTGTGDGTMDPTPAI
ncbi:30S ribosome-binding factor RbfA [Bifidobacterium favimelis]|uniref:Ribosome-binding factor A n=1 Tax=Bifidobacterium favimelis TaxID=3122979 RepID=A0ABU8ZLV0_9BIFI